MNKNYTLLLIAILTSSILIGQTNLLLNPRLNVPNAEKETRINYKTTSCIDDILYPQSKLTGLPEIDTMDVATYISGTSQAFYFSGDGLIHGINAYMLLDVDGVPGNSSPVSVLISVYDIDNANYPTTLIAEDTVMLMDVGFANQDLNFTAPVAVTDSFAVAVQLNTLDPSNPYYVTNTSAANDGQGEALSCVYYAGSWYNGFIDFGGWNMDILIAPIFEENYSANYFLDTNVVCLGNEVLFTNSSSSSENIMFTTAPTSLVLDYGDLNSSSIDTNISYLYTSVGDFTSSFTLTHNGYNGSCVDDSSITISVLDTAISNYNYASLGGGAYQFTDMSSNANTYYWDFGDGDTSTIQSPTHTYLTANNYNVCLTVTDSNGCNVNTSCQTVSFVTAVESKVNQEEVKIYPIPANKYFNILIPSNYKNGSIVITDVVGKTVKSIEINNQENIKILTQEINSGVYFLSIENEGQKVYSKRILVDK
ncbi:PKD domain-containing protein [Vicingus serpentipes]|uniref:PKD domain-containing protein n=1 Tax=Vicingus serpentipes TaxID=1926625 RepID=A0A5C6RZM8_9FLAO|nr:PKD domain-containing protein [Vicingus serpentipes]TXB67090.1 PKD domain-containing protein [Vicingus serpentipes]